MSYAPRIFPVRVVSKAQLNKGSASHRFHRVALISGGFAEFCSQICSQLGRVGTVVAQSLLAIVGCGPLTAAKIVGETALAL
jgi:hypothetical protein